MPVREFANQKALIDHADQNGLVYVWAFSMREQLVSPRSPNASRCSRRISTRLWMCVRFVA